jgi:hypothetical protein
MRIKFIFLGFIFLLVGCVDNNKTTVSPYPEIDQKPPSSAQTTQTDFNAIWETAPQIGKSIIKGKIILKSSSILVGELYLARAVPTSNKEILLLELDQSIAPKAVIDRSTMRFVFLDVEPGMYGIIAWEPLNSFSLSDPVKEDTLFIDVQPNHVIDLGNIQIP